MKLNINKEKFVEGLQKSASIIPAKSGTAFLRSVWLKAQEGAISVMSTDANVEFTGSYEADVEESGFVGVQGKLFVDFVRTLLPGKITLSLDKAHGSQGSRLPLDGEADEASVLLVKQGRARCELPVSTADWFQNFSEYPEEGAVIWSGDFLQDLLDKISFCIDEESGMDAITCLFIKPVENGRIDVCGLNGHQFAMKSFIHDELFARLPEQGLLVQKQYLQNIRKWLGQDEIEVNFTEKRFFLRTQGGNEIISVPRATYDFPDYTAFLSRLEDDATKLCFNRKEAIAVLSRILLFNTDAEPCTYFDLSENECLLYVQGKDVGSVSDSFSVEYDGSVKRIAFPTKKLIEVLEHFVSDRIEMTITSEEGPCGIHGQDDPFYTVIIMPMKIMDQFYSSEETA